MNRWTHSAKLVAASTLLLFLSGSMNALLGAEYSLANHSECSDGRDNDGDGRIDYPQDSDCTSLDDTSEGTEESSALFVSVTDGRDTVIPGDSVIYAITLRQQRTATRTVNVDFHIPAQASMVGASNGGYLRDGYIHWDNVSVSKDDTRRLTVQAYISPTAQENTLLVGRVVADNVQATDTTTIKRNGIPSDPQFRAWISDYQETARPGENLTYTVSVRNLTNGSLTQDIRMTIPHLSSFVSASDAPSRTNEVLTWRDVSFDANEAKTFTVTVHIDPRITEFYNLTARVNVGLLSVSDRTVITSALPQTQLNATIDDHIASAQHGDPIHYTIHVRNNSPYVETNGNVTASLPIYAEFVDATEGGVWSNGNVRWNHLQIAPYGTRDVSFTVRVRKDAPYGDSLLAGVTVNGMSAKDYTTVGATKRVRPYLAENNRMYDTARPVYWTSMPSQTQSSTPSANAFFRKSADRSEVVPGGTIRYTLTVRNTLDHGITNAVISDRFDPTMLSLVSGSTPQNVRMLGTNGQMQWNVPTLAPGQSWSTSYTLSTSATLPQGTIVSNLATIQGNDLTGISLQDRVQTVRVGVLRTMPQTGAAADSIFLMLSSVLGLAPVFAFRKIA